MKKSLIFTVLFFIFVAVQLFGQSELSLEQKLNYTDLVLEGKVVHQTPFLEKDQIFTLNEVMVYKLFKGSYAGKYISVVTEGGRYGDRETTCDHCLGFRKGEMGIFLAKEKPIAFGQDHRYTISLGTEGFYRYFTRNEHFVAATYQEIYEDRTVLHRNLEKFLGKSHTVVALTEEELSLKKWFSAQPIRMQTADYCVQYEFKNLQVRYINFQVQVDVDIYIKALTDAFKLTKSKLAFEYASVLGNNIVTNQLITVTKGDATQQPNYQLTVADISANKFYLSLESGIVDSTLLENIGNNPETLCHLRLQVANLSPNAVLFFNPDALNTESKYYDNGQDLFFECYRNLESFSGALTSLLSPTITDFNPKVIGAGTYNVTMPNPMTDVLRSKSMLTITGTEFGADKGEVFFTNAYTGPNGGFMKVMPDDILLWTDVMIQVKVPSCGQEKDPLLPPPSGCSNTYLAGTGKIAIRKANQNSLITSDETLNVKWALKNRDSRINNKTVSVSSRFKNINGNGGYTILFENLTPDEELAIKRALIT